MNPVVNRPFSRLRLRVYYELPHGQIAEISRLAGLWWAVLYDRPRTFELAFSL